MTPTWTLGLPLPDREFQAFRPFKEGLANSLAESILRDLQDTLTIMPVIDPEERKGPLHHFTFESLDSLAKGRKGRIVSCSGKLDTLILPDGSFLLLAYDEMSSRYSPMPYAFYSSKRARSDDRNGRLALFEEMEKHISAHAAEATFWHDYSLKLPDLYLVDSMPPGANDPQLIPAWAACDLLDDEHRVTLRQACQDLCTGFAAKHGFDPEESGSIEIEISGRPVYRDGSIGKPEIDITMPIRKHGSLAKEFHQLCEDFLEILEGPNSPVPAAAMVSTRQSPDRYLHNAIQQLIAAGRARPLQSAHERLEAIPAMNSWLAPKAT